MKHMNRSLLYRLLMIIGMSMAMLPVSILAQTTAQNSAEDDAGVTDIQVRSWVDRTAVFAGDTVRYHIEVLCTDNVDILMDDLDADELALSGLELLSSGIKQEQTAAGTKYHAVYELISFDTDRTNLVIDELRVRYYFKRPGQRIEDVATVGEVVVPATALVMRSTLQGELSELELRDLSASIMFSSWLGISGTMGLLLIIVSGIPLALLISSRRREAVLASRPPQHEVLEETFSELEQIKQLDATDTQQRRQGFDHLQTLLKEYIEKRNGMITSALTANEIQLRLASTELGVSLEELGSVLADCERARYDRQENLPDANILEDGVVLAQSLLSSR